MTKLELTLSAKTLECVSYDEVTGTVLGLPSASNQATKIHISKILADQNELQQFQSAVDKLTKQSANANTSFETLNLVFRAPNAPEEALPSDRSPLNGIFCSPMRAIHTSDQLHLSCFTHIYYDSQQNLFRISALEYSRKHRSQLLRQEFASWLVEEHIEKSVIATRADGTVVFWNRFASSLYQYQHDEAMGKGIDSLISSKLSLEQGDELKKRTALGEHFTSMYPCSRKDQSEFMAHVTTTPITDDQGQTQFLVGVSADYSQLHSVLAKLEALNANLEREVAARTNQLLAREKHLRMIGQAMKESDTGVLITDANYKITWCNDAVSRMLGLKLEVILGMFPWDLPLQQEQKQEVTNVDIGNGADATMIIPEEKSSSLEPYFLQEKEFNESNSPTNLSSNAPPLFATKAADLERNSKINAAELASDASMPDATMTSTSTIEDDGEADVGVNANNSTTSSSKRPPMAAICYRIDRPSMPLHIMVSVELMPADKTMKITRSSSIALRKPLRDALELTETQGDSDDVDTMMPNTSFRLNDQPSQRIEPPKSFADLGPNRSPSKKQFMITLRDVTAERKAEEAQLIAERASAANEAKTQMMQMLSHELRTPLQGIMGVASTSMMDIEDLDNSNLSNSNHNTDGEGGGVKGTMYDSLSTILASSRLLLTLINNTLDTRKINADMMQKIELSTVSLMSCTRDSFQYCGPFAAINEAVLELADPNGGNVKLQQILNTSKSNLMSDVLKKKFNVIGNRLRLEQVIVNLLSNGIKYTTPGTAVVASVRNSTLEQVMGEMKAAPSSSLKFLSEEDMKELEDSCKEVGSCEVCIFSVRDHGKGIPPEEYGKVFGEFQQLDASAEKDNKYDGTGSGQSSGSGLGLNLSMKFVTLMNGHIWFQNCTDGAGGVTFSFYLKRSRAPRKNSKLSLSGRVDEFGHPAKLQTMASEANLSDSFRGEEPELQEDKVARIRVLVIDDSMINLKVLARMMAKLKVQHCQTALSGQAALEYLEPIRNDPSLVPNLILCDLQMPGMDGYELMIHLREMNICSSPIIMACSADWGSETEGKCHDVGFDGLLRKPVTVAHLKDFLTNSKL